jgi:hypothetical protein
MSAEPSSVTPYPFAAVMDAWRRLGVRAALPTRVYFLDGERLSKDG